MKINHGLKRATDGGGSFCSARGAILRGCHRVKITTQDVGLNRWDEANGLNLGGTSADRVAGVAEIDTGDPVRDKTNANPRIKVNFRLKKD